MKKTFIALAMIGAMAFSMTVYGGESETVDNAESAETAADVGDVGEAPDYSEAECWYMIPEITKDVDTFYIYSTMYGGANEGDPDCAPLDNAEVLANIGIEHAIKSSVFEDSTNRSALTH